MALAKRQAGLSIVEVMVGLVIGTLVTLAAWGTVMFYESNRRTGMGGNSALENGMAAAFSIQRDIRAAGLGFVFGGRAACPTLNVYFNGAVAANGTTLAPVTITDGGAASDTVSIAYADSILGGAPLPLISTMASAGDLVKVSGPASFATGDLMLVASPSGADPCTLMQVTDANVTGFGTELAHAQGMWNPSDPAGAFANAPAYAASSSVVRVGAFNWVTYRVNGANLEVVDNVTGQASVLAENIVYLKAQYGASNGIAPKIEQWTAAVDAWVPPLDAAHIAALRAVRIVVVARAPHREKAAAGGACNATTAPPATWVDGPAIDLSANPDWQCYRYKTILLTIPLKNMIFGSQT